MSVYLIWMELVTRFFLTGFWGSGGKTDNSKGEMRGALYSALRSGRDDGIYRWVGMTAGWGARRSKDNAKADSATLRNDNHKSKYGDSGCAIMTTHGEMTTHGGDDKQRWHVKQNAIAVIVVAEPGRGVRLEIRLETMDGTWVRLARTLRDTGPRDTTGGSCGWSRRCGRLPATGWGTGSS